MDINGRRFGTLAIHAGQEPDPTTGAIMTPIFQTSTYVQDAVGKHRGFEYSRTDNPTRRPLEACLAALEGARHGVCFASGCAATTTILQLLPVGSHIVSSDDVYGGTWRLFERVLKPLGYRFSFGDLSRPGVLDGLLKDDTAMVWVETPSNPLLKVIDIEAAAASSRRVGARLVVDNTFASSAFQQPLSLGADLVVHSTTKYLNGHSDVVGGVVLTSDDELAERLRFFQNAVGAVPGPMDCFLTLRGLKTLHLRMNAHADAAERVVELLSGHSEVARVHYPGLSEHVGHEAAARQMKRFGGMVSFELAGDLARARRFVESTTIFTLAESLGGVESLIELPALMTHAAMTPEARRASGIEDGLIRLSVGVEDPADILEDLVEAFEKSR